MMHLPHALTLILSVFGAAATIQAQQAPMVVVLVRHAEKAPAPADDPGLTDAGRTRAAALADALSDARVDAIITTAVERTRQTAAPLARKQHVTPIVVPAGADTPTHVRAVAAAVRRQAAGALVVVVGHSNTLPGIIAALGGPALPDLCDEEYSRLFTLVLSGEGPPRLIRSAYGAPDAAEPCGRTMVR